MPISGFVDYKRREYCKDIKCHVQILMNSIQLDSEEYKNLRKICTDSCLRTTFEFHHWLIDHDYQIVRKDQEGEK